VGASVALTFAFGTVGPALGSLVAVLVVDTVYLPRRVSRMLGQPYVTLARRVYLPLAVPIALFAAALAAGRLLGADGGWTLLAAGLAALTFAAAWWRTPVAVDVRRILRADGLHAARGT